VDRSTPEDKPIKDFSDDDLAQALLRTLITIRPELTAIVMIGRNERPHSKHYVCWNGSCMEVRGLLEQCSELVRRDLHGTKQLPGSGDRGEY
jgi:hypothetical protein